MIRELEDNIPQKKLFCSECHNYADKGVTLIEVKYTSYVTRMVCLPCLKKILGD